MKHLGLTEKQWMLIFFMTGIMIVASMWRREKFVSVGGDNLKKSAADELKEKREKAAKEEGPKKKDYLVLHDPEHPRAFELELDNDGKKKPLYSNLNCAGSQLTNLKFQDKDGVLNNKWCDTDDCYLYQSASGDSSPEYIPEGGQGLKCRCRHEWTAKLANEDKERQVYEWTYLTNAKTNKLARYDFNNGDVYYCEKQETDPKGDKYYVRWLQQNDACPKEAQPKALDTWKPAPIDWTSTDKTVQPLPYNSSRLQVRSIDKKMVDPITNRKNIP
jgi:hypothetical protein